MQTVLQTLARACKPFFKLVSVCGILHPLTRQNWRFHSSACYCYGSCANTQPLPGNFPAPAWKLSCDRALDSLLRSRRRHSGDGWVLWHSSSPSIHSVPAMARVAPPFLQPPATNPNTVASASCSCCRGRTHRPVPRCPSPRLLHRSQREGWSFQAPGRGGGRPNALKKAVNKLVAHCPARLERLSAHATCCTK